MTKTMVLALAIVTAGSAQTSADGNLTVDKEKVTQAYAYAAPGFCDKQKDDTADEVSRQKGDKQGHCGMQFHEPEDRLSPMRSV